MKKLFVSALLISAFVSCSDDTHEITMKKDITFAVSGEFTQTAFSRALMADGSEMTDLWIYDYMDGVLKQQVHQSSTDDDFGTPTLSLDYGTHTVYFVAARGRESTAGGTVISWQKPSDTFWITENITVTSGTSATKSVTLSRVTTKLRLLVLDKVPQDIASVTVRPAQWWYGLDYTSGTAATPNTNGFSISVPSSYQGTEGSLILSIYGMSDTGEWMTDVDIIAKDASGSTIGAATIHDAPFLRNRVTEYSGRLFTLGSSMEISLDDTWLPSYTSEW